MCLCVERVESKNEALFSCKGLKKKMFMFVKCERQSGKTRETKIEKMKSGK
jgi:hypothetical protein